MRRLGRSLLAAVLIGLLPATVWAAEPVRIYAAGNLGMVLPELIAASGLSSGTVASPVFCPAGTFRDRLLAGLAADLFASADTAAPVAVVAKAGGLVVPFARNRMCLLAPERLGLTATNLLDRMLSPDFRLAASTPGADSSGDYAQSVFKRADTLRPGAGAILVSVRKLFEGY